ncbi:MAG: PilZ domain-containing protein [Acidobacteriota bacterium]
MEKRAQSRLVPEGSLKCTVEWDNGQEAGRIHNISAQGALLEAKSDFGISRIKLTLDFEETGESVTVNAAIRWHAVSPQDQTDHYGLVFRSVDEATKEKLDGAIRTLMEKTST